MTQCWQAELRKENIRVFLVNPSEVTTAFNQEDRNEREEVSNKLTPQEIAAALCARAHLWLSHLGHHINNTPFLWEMVEYPFR